MARRTMVKDLAPEGESVDVLPQGLVRGRALTESAVSVRAFERGEQQCRHFGQVRHRSAP